MKITEQSGVCINTMKFWKQCQKLEFTDMVHLQQWPRRFLSSTDLKVLNKDGPSLDGDRIVKHVLQRDKDSSL